jgi:hypothetical protein
MTKSSVKKSFFSFCVMLEEIKKRKREIWMKKKSTMNVFLLPSQK